MTGFMFSISSTREFKTSYRNVSHLHDRGVTDTNIYNLNAFCDTPGGLKTIRCIFKTHCPNSVKKYFEEVQCPFKAIELNKLSAYAKLFFKYYNPSKYLSTNFVVI